MIKCNKHDSPQESDCECCEDRFTCFTGGIDSNKKSKVAEYLLKEDEIQQWRFWIRCLYKNITNQRLPKPRWKRETMGKWWKKKSIYHYECPLCGCKKIIKNKFEEYDHFECTECDYSKIA